MRLERIRQVLDPLPCLPIVIPGNHNAEPHRFYSAMPAPPDYVAVGSVRLVPFVDAEEPGLQCAAERRPQPLRDRRFRPAHLRLLRDCGYNGDLTDAIAAPIR